MSLLNVASLFLFSFVIATTTMMPVAAAAALQGVGIQSGPDTASSYAGGMIYDDEEGVVYLTGATYGSSFFDRVAPSLDQQQQDGGLASKVPYFCFAAAISWLPFNSTSNASTSSSSSSTMTWEQQRQSLATGSDHSQACTALALSAAVASSSKSNQPNLHLAGYQVQYLESGSVNVSGILFNTNLSSSSTPQGSAFFVGQVVYPKAVASVANTTSTSLFVASMSAAKVTASSPTTTSVDTLDPTTHLIGTNNNGTANFSMHIQKLVRSTTQSGNTTTAAWIPEWSKTIVPINGESVQVSSILFLPKPNLVNDGGDADDVDMLLVAGSTTGFGLALGANYQSSGPDDLDGFVTKIRAADGDLPLEVGEEVAISNTSLQFGATYSTRISSQSKKNDIVYGLCRQEEDPLGSTLSPLNVVYVVGTTQGIIAGRDAGGAFLIQLDLETFQVKWKQQISGTNVEGMACTVTPDGQDVYLSGTYAHDTRLTIVTELQRRRQRKRRRLASSSSSSNKDIFVAQFAATNGTLNWIQTIGTPKEDEYLAQGGALTVDAQGNVLVYGNTRGSLFRNNTQGTNDIFVMVLSRIYEEEGGGGIFGTLRKQSNAQLFRGMVAVLLLVLLLILVLVLMVFRRSGRQSRAVEAPADTPTTNELSSPWKEQSMEEADVPTTMETTAERNQGNTESFHSPLPPESNGTSNGSLDHSPFRQANNSSENGQFSSQLSQQDEHAIV